MPRHSRCANVLLLLALPSVACAGDWTQFRGPSGLGVSDETGVPVRWSSSNNIVWKQELPGPGASSPITLRGRVFVTCYSGYGLEPAAGDQKNLRRHLLCYDRGTGDLVWKTPDAATTRGAPHTRVPCARRGGAGQFA